MKETGLNSLVCFNMEATELKSPFFVFFGVTFNVLFGRDSLIVILSTKNFVLFFSLGNFISVLKIFYITQETYPNLRQILRLFSF